MLDICRNMYKYAMQITEVHVQWGNANKKINSLIEQHHKYNMHKTNYASSNYHCLQYISRQWPQRILSSFKLMNKCYVYQKHHGYILWRRADVDTVKIWSKTVRSIIKQFLTVKAHCHRRVDFFSSYYAIMHLLCEQSLYLSIETKLLWPLWVMQSELACYGYL